MLGARAVLTAAAALSAALWFAGRDAAGFSLGTTDAGGLTRWRTDYIQLKVDPSVEAIAPAADVASAFRWALQEWISEADLPILPICEVEACGGAAYSSVGPNESCVYAAAEASDGADADVGGTAHVSYVQDTGEIVDVDIALSTAAGPWSLTAEDGSLSLRAVALHELGHLLGLGHSEFEDAAMYPMAAMDAEQRESLATDDVNGAHALYDDGEAEEYGCTAAVPGARGLTGFLCALFSY